MVTYGTKKIKTARLLAFRKRRKGFNATVFKKKDGYGVSVTRKKK